jgi:hypothetical protein
VEDAADDIRVRRAEENAPVLRRYAETRYGAKSWSCERRVVDPPPLKWSALRYGFEPEEDRDGEQEAPA